MYTKTSIDSFMMDAFNSDIKDGYNKIGVKSIINGLNSLGNIIIKCIKK